MEFKDKEKQAEWSAFAAYYSLVAKRPITDATRSRLNQLRTIAMGDFGNGAFQELLRDLNKQKIQAQPTERVLLGKRQGGGNGRRNPSPAVAPKKVEPKGKRLERLIQRGVVPQSGKSEAFAVVAVGSVIQPPEPVKTERPPKVPAEKPVEPEIIEAPNDLIADAATMSANDLVKKYEREVFLARLISLGESAELLEKKSDRQLANLLKKKLCE